MLKNLIFSLGCLLFAISQAIAYEYDPENGEEINEVCAGCHGEYAQGGKEGEYPRLAGMPVVFIAKQLYLFRQRKRPNLAMVEYVDDRQMPDSDIEDVARYIGAIQLETRLAPVDETAPGFDAYARLLAAKKLMQIPIAPGDSAQGEKLYKKECASCHGKSGSGDAEDGVPMLAGQYISYLWRQVGKYREKIRIHDEDEPQDELLLDFTDEEMQDMFAYISTLDD